MILRLPDELKAMLEKMQHDVGGMVLAAFLLGDRLGKKAEDTEKLLELLNEVASGDMTTQPTGAELRQQFPTAPQDIEAIRTENQKVERIIAHLLCERLSRK